MSKRRAAAGPRRSPRSGSPRRVSDLLAVLDRIAPFSGAAEWDNVGLLAGDRSRTADPIITALDLSDAVAAEILDCRARTAVLYHPPIFKPIARITPDAPGPTSRLADLLAAGVSLVAVHTALDAAIGGTNDVLLDAFAPASRLPLTPLLRAGRQCKLVVFAPRELVEPLRAALSQAGAGRIGHYSECSFETSGQGTFRGDSDTQPSVGRAGALERVDEQRLEMVVPTERLGDVIRRLHAVHTYEEPAYDVIPLHSLDGRGAAGMGRIGRLARPRSGRELVRQLRSRVDLSTAQVVGTLDREFSSVTAAAGSFGVHAFRDADSLVLTGEFKHHDALDLLRRGVTAIALGHYASERPALESLAARLADEGFEVQVAASDCSPLRRLERTEKA